VVVLWSCGVGVVVSQPCGVMTDTSQSCGMAGGHMAVMCVVVVVLLHCRVAGQWWPHRGHIMVVMVVVVHHGGHGSYIAGVLLLQLWLWLWRGGWHGWLQWGWRGSMCNRRVHSNMACVVTCVVVGCVVTQYIW